uniref:hypothetical protein n=1 Tax=Synechococcus sp. UW106 TaxID=368495 RepID=UPI000E0EC2BB|nr:hypothetical protein [Synechococcus sp. UW106]
MSIRKTYATNKQLGLNVNGIQVPYQHKGAIPPSAPKSPHHIANDGGWMRPLVRQTGWRVQCAQVGSCGGYEITIGTGIHKTILPGMGDKVDFTVDEPGVIRVEHIGMLCRDWSALVISRVY